MRDESVGFLGAGLEPVRTDPLVMVKPSALEATLGELHWRTGVARRIMHGVLDPGAHSGVSLGVGGQLLVLLHRILLVAETRDRDWLQLLSGVLLLQWNWSWLARSATAPRPASKGLAAPSLLQSARTALLDTASARAIAWSRA